MAGPPEWVKGSEQRLPVSALEAGLRADVTTLATLLSRQTDRALDNQVSDARKQFHQVKSR